MAYQTLRQEYLQMPVVTRAYTTACVVTSLAVQLDLISPFQLYFNPILIVKQFQIWRLFTTFLFFGTVGLNFFFNVIFTYRYCRMLEEGSFRGRTADFVMMFIFGGVTMITGPLTIFLGRFTLKLSDMDFSIPYLLAYKLTLFYYSFTLFGSLKTTFGLYVGSAYMPIFAFFVSLLFLGQAFTIMLVYVWSRRNPYVRMSFFGVLNFNAPYLPWVLLGFSLLMSNAVWVDFVGIAVGHMYFFIEDVFPNLSGGFRLLVTPQILKRLFDPLPEEVPQPADRPGGFNWGEALAANQDAPQPGLPDAQ